MVSENEEIEHLRKALQTGLQGPPGPHNLPIKLTSQLSSWDLGSKCVREHAQLMERHGLFRVSLSSCKLYEGVFSKLLLNKNA